MKFVFSVVSDAKAETSMHRIEFFCGLWNTERNASPDQYVRKQRHEFRASIRFEREPECMQVVSTASILYTFRSEQGWTNILGRDAPSTLHRMRNRGHWKKEKAGKGNVTGVSNREDISQYFRRQNFRIETCPRSMMSTEKKLLYPSEHKTGDAPYSNDMIRLSPARHKAMSVRHTTNKWWR